jgi:hypothetical protein
MLEKIEAPPAVAGDSATALDVKLGTLAGKLGLGDVPAVGKSRRVGEPLAEHRWDERRRRSHEVHRTNARILAGVESMLTSPSK